MKNRVHDITLHMKKQRASYSWWTHNFKLSLDEQIAYDEYMSTLLMKDLTLKQLCDLLFEWCFKMGLGTVALISLIYWLT